MKFVQNREMDQLLSRLADEGIVVAAKQGRKCSKVVLRNGRLYFVAITPSCPSSLRNAEAGIRRTAAQPPRRTDA